MTHTIEVDRVLNFLAGMPKHGNTVTTRSAVRELLSRTDGKLMEQGTLWEIVVKHKGAGMYRVSLEDKP